jgi:hypothetical protein
MIRQNQRAQDHVTSTYRSRDKRIFEFHDLDMINIPDGGTEKSNHKIHQNFVIFGFSIVENLG